MFAHLFAVFNCCSLLELFFSQLKNRIKQTKKPHLTPDALDQILNTRLVKGHQHEIGQQVEHLQKSENSGVNSWKNTPKNQAAHPQE